VYRPAELIDPAPPGSIVQATAVLLMLLTLAVNCCVWPGLSTTPPGLTLTVIGGTRVIAAEKELVESPNVVAVMGTVCCDVILFGAV
jgi:hypothetical protein